MFSFIDDQCGENAAKCIKCTEPCGTQWRLLDHKRNKCPKSWIPCPHNNKTNTQGYRCKFWGFRENMDHHIQQVHTKIKCKYCASSILQKFYLQHLNDHMVQSIDQHQILYRQLEQIKIQLESNNNLKNDIAQLIIAETEKLDSKLLPAHEYYESLGKLDT